MGVKVAQAQTSVSQNARQRRTFSYVDRVSQAQPILLLWFSHFTFNLAALDNPDGLVEDLRDFIGENIALFTHSG